MAWRRCEVVIALDVFPIKNLSGVAGCRIDPPIYNLWPAERREVAKKSLENLGMLLAAVIG